KWPAAEDRGGWRAPPGGPPVADRASRAEAFFATLPPDELTEQELELRQVVIAYLERHSAGPGEPVRISDVTVDPVISAARARLLPQEVPLRAWLDQRIGGEVEISSDPKTGIWQAGLRSDAGAEEPTGGGGPGSSAVARDDFFAGLPENTQRTGGAAPRPARSPGGLARRRAPHAPGRHGRRRGAQGEGAGAAARLGAGVAEGLDRAEDGRRDRDGGGGRRPDALRPRGGARLGGRRLGRDEAEGRRAGGALWQEGPPRRLGASCTRRCSVGPALSLAVPTIAVGKNKLRAFSYLVAN
ncbi:unnamed protein product, partial [Prorocentrum cordatum]